MGCLPLHIENESPLRVAYSKKMEKPLKKVVDYYPFGLKHKGYNNATSPNGNSTAQKFKYNGMELEESLGVDWYEMDMRQYDPAIARWTAMDPVIHHAMSTYTAFDNNPIFFADPTGADSESSISDLINDIWNRSGDDGYAYSYDGDGNLTGVTEAENNDDCKKNPNQEKCKKKKKKLTMADAGSMYAKAQHEALAARAAMERGGSVTNLTAADWARAEEMKKEGAGEFLMMIGGEWVLARLLQGGKWVYTAIKGKSLITNAKWAQKTFSSAFSTGGKFAGKTVDEVSALLRSGKMKPSDVQIDFIVRDGQTLILNTRSSAALTKAGIPRSQWSTVNKTGQEFFENQLTNQLKRNKLTSQGTSTIRQSGTKNVIGSGN